MITEEEIEKAAKEFRGFDYNSTGSCSQRGFETGAKWAIALMEEKSKGEASRITMNQLGGLEMHLGELGIEKIVFGQSKELSDDVTYPHAFVQLSPLKFARLEFKVQQMCAYREGPK